MRRLDTPSPGPLSPSELRDKMAAADRSARRLNGLVDKLLEITRLTSGKMDLRLERVNLGDVVRTCLEGVQQLASRAGSTIVPVIDHVTVETAGDQARLTVRDEGIGISDADQQRIFERFERAVPEKHFGGFGLGLWLTQKIVKAHGGQIRVSSQPDSGSTFIVELPRQAPGG